MHLGKAIRGNSQATCPGLNNYIRQKGAVGTGNELLYMRLGRLMPLSNYSSPNIDEVNFRGRGVIAGYAITHNFPSQNVQRLKEIIYI